jgi:hypothetical protein
MVQPINYLAMMPRVDIPGAIEGFGEALQARQQRKAAEELKVQYSTDLQQVLQNPSMRAFNEFALKYPSQREVIKDVAGRFSQEQLDSEFDVGAQIAVSLENQNPDVALNVVEKTIQARKTAGLPTTTYDQIQQILSNTEDPDRVNKAKAITNFSLTLLNPEKFGKVVQTLEAQEMRPGRVEEQTAKAKKAAVDANFAESQAVADLGLKKAQIENYAVDAEVARANLKINALNAQLKKEENVLKRQELNQKLLDAETELDDKLRKRVSDANNAFANFDNFLNTADRALAGWEKDKAGKIDIKKPKGYVESATGPISTRLPTLSQDTADFEEQIESLKSQAFLSQVEKMKGLGALTEREGAALTAALTNMNLRQSPEQLGRNLLEAQRLILKARDEAARKYGVGAAPDRPAGPGGAAPAQAPGVPSAMGTATDRAVAPTAAPTAMPSGFRVLGRE